MFEQFGAPAWADRPESRPPGYEYLVRSGLAGTQIAPWGLLPVDQVAHKTKVVLRYFPSRKLVVFAVRFDRDDVACWDAESLDHKIYSITSFDAGEKWAYMDPHNSLSNWLRAVLELSEGDDLHDWFWPLKPGMRPEELDEQPDELQPRLTPAAFHAQPTSDVPSWLAELTLDPYYQILRYKGLARRPLLPWILLSEVDLVSTSVTLSRVFGDRQFVAYARHRDTGALACWDASRRDYTVYVLDRWWQRRDIDQVVTYRDMFAWQRAALEDFISAGPQVPYWLSRDGYEPFEC